jgi:glycosyltransferase involved in cell wall biosynthesis
MSSLPRILIVSELSLSFSKNGRSANPTLFNLFENYPSELLMQYVPTSTLRDNPPSPPFENRVISFSSQYLQPLRNRLGIILNYLIDAINFKLIEWLSIPNKSQLDNFNPEIILVCPITPVCLIMGYKLMMEFKRPVLIYFMDNWMAYNRHPKWLYFFLQNLTHQYIQDLTYQILKQSVAWLMISEQLKDELSSRYKITPQSSLIVHNPVVLSNKSLSKIDNKYINDNDIFRIAYAGSIQVMHYDALASVAEAVYELRNEGVRVELVVYTASVFWDIYKTQLQTWEVIYGSLIPYNELNEYLKCANLLLVATSFLPEYDYIIRSSILTKLTDYMATGIPIMSCGPSYSACNHFVNKWECGLVCETNNVPEIKSFIVKQMNDYSLNQEIAINAFKVLENQFEQSKVSNSLYSFIEKNVVS